MEAATCLTESSKENWQTSLEMYLVAILELNSFLTDTWFAFKGGVMWDENSQAYLSDYMPLYEQGVEAATYYTDYHPEIYYDSAATALEFVWTAPYYDPVIEMALVSATHPIFVTYDNGTTEFVGVAGLDVDLAFLQIELFIVNAELGEGYTFLIDNAHEAILAHPTSEFTFVSTTGQSSYGEWGKLASSLSTSETDPKGELSTIIADMRLNREGKAVWGEYVVFYSSIDTIDASIAFVYPQSQINAGVSSLVTLSLIIIGIATIVMTALIFLVSRSISNPIKSLADVSQIIAQGDFNTKIEIKAKDETKNLIDNFQTMVVEVNDKMEFLNSLIKNLPLPIQVMDENLNIIMYNDLLRDYLGVTDDHITKCETCAKLWNTPVCGTDKCFTTRAANDKCTIHEIYDVETAAGDKLYFDVYAVPIYDGTGKLTNKIEILQDITKKQNLVKAVQTIAGEVNSMSSQIAESSNQINLSVQEVTGGTQEIAKGSQHQTQSVNLISEAVLKVQNVSANIVKNSADLSQQGAEGQGMAQKGKDLTDDLVVQISEMTVGADKVSQTMNSLEIKSKEINKIVEVLP